MYAAQGKKREFNKCSGKDEKRRRKEYRKMIIIIKEKRGYYAPKVELGGWASNIKR